MELAIVINFFVAKGRHYQQKSTAELLSGSLATSLQISGEVGIGLYKLMTPPI